MRNKHVRILLEILSLALIYYTVADQSIVMTIVWYLGIVLVTIATAIYIARSNRQKIAKLSAQIPQRIVDASCKVTDVSTNMVMSYMDKQFPDWIEINGAEIYEYTGITPLSNGVIDINKVSIGTFVTGEGVIYTQVKGALNLLEA